MSSCRATLAARVPIPVRCRPRGCWNTCRGCTSWAFRSPTSTQWPRPIRRPCWGWMRNRRLLILAALLLASPAAAQQRWQPEDHLEPDGSILGGTAFSAIYDTLVRDLLRDAYDMSVDVRMVALPSFSPEYAVGLRSFETRGAGPFKSVAKGAPYHIFVLAPEAQIWTYQTIAM